MSPGWQPSGDASPPFEVERQVLPFLLETELSGRWSVWELRPQIGSEGAAGDAVLRLHAAGLVHLCHEFVWATHSAARAHHLTDTA